HRDVHRAAGEIAERSLEKKCSGADVLRGNFVGEIDDVRFGTNAGDHTFHHPDVGVERPEVGEQRDGGARAHGVEPERAKWASSASSKPGSVYSFAHTFTTRPSSRAVSAVTGPIAATTTRLKSSRWRGPSAAASSRTVELEVNVTASMAPASRSAVSASISSRGAGRVS